MTRSTPGTHLVAHRFEDGGGRELGYVSMSRGRQANTVHVVAAAIPPDPSAELARLDCQLTELHRNRSGLVTGQGRYAGAPEGDAARRLAVARDRYRDAQHYADTLTGWRDRRHWRKEAQRWADAESTAEAAYSRTVPPEARRLDEATRRLRALDRELNPPAELPDVIRELGRTQAIGIRRDVGLQPPSHGIELDFGPSGLHFGKAPDADATRWLAAHQLCRIGQKACRFCGASQAPLFVPCS